MDLLSSAIPANAPLASEGSLRRIPGMARVFGVIGYDRRRGLSPEQHEYLARQIAIVRIELTTP